MKTARLMPEMKLVEEAVSVLMKRLGPVETSRFLAMKQKKRLDSVTRHRRWQDSLRKNQYFDAVFGG